MKIKKHTMA